ncbi:MAG: beta-ketoacyl synthase, partial [Candidatus Marinimicrobia bacterium]|nr:beta-ketoacyl synthase [Candidatus Neomarinimicrobiota bacterium]
MARLPVIVGFGGINPAGRSSAHHGYRRMVIDRLDQGPAQQTYAALAQVMGLTRDNNGQTVDSNGTVLTQAAIAEEYASYIKDNTLIRRLEDNLFDRNHIPENKIAILTASPEQPIIFTLKRKQLPATIPENWKVSDLDQNSVKVEVQNSMDVFLPSTRSSKVQSAGQLPTGFDPARLYQSRNHPRGLQMTIYGASDAVQSIGIDWETIRSAVAPDKIGVLSGSAMGQLDYDGSGGMLQAQLLGKRVSAKQLPLGLVEMPADFINAYILGSVGATGCNVGACATFMYNLQVANQDIQSGRRRVVVVGTSEAPITPEIIEGYRTMGALAEDDKLLALDPDRDTPDFQRASRPFSDNCGFTLSESSQFFVLFDDELAMELGANIYGSVADVFINADGYKKSIPGPGVGNYITVGKAAAVIKAIIGEEGLRRKSYVHAHGTSTPQNRVTESHIINEIARVNGIDQWTVAAVKCYLGHSLGSSASDQLMASLGTWKYGLIPGIVTSDHLADDVHNSNLRFILDHDEVGATGMDAVLMNAKGFGGNNATGAILSPQVTEELLENKYGRQRMSEYRNCNQAVAEAADLYDCETTAGRTTPIYRFDHNVV